jgi:pimeloyl-ACP methyl ester carboxylesterase
MRPPFPVRLSILSIVFATMALAAVAQTPTAIEGKTPIIVIPGLTGSELINKTTGKTAWFRRSRPDDDDVRLPMSANLARNSDDLIAGDIIREVRLSRILPEIEIYAKLIEGLQTTGGYREAKWETATRNDASDTFFVFSYDWRRDNVENARLLIRRIETLKRRLGKPDLKFNIVAHSMGGLISRYAAMYGDADIPGGKPRPTWAGARHLDKVFLVGTPNEGSLLAFKALLNGVAYIGGGIKLPFVQDLTRFDVFTVPSVFQLLPHEKSMLVYDEELKPLNIDIYDPAAWEEYDWAIWKDKDFEKKFSPAEQRNARPFFRAAIERAKRFQAALNATSNAKVPVSYYLLGAQCKETATAMLLRRDEKKDRWITQFDAESYTNSLGMKITSEMLKPIIYTPGDSVVPKRSLEAATLRANGYEYVLPIAAELYQCETHGKLVTNPEIQQKLFALIQSPSVIQNAGTQP